MAQISKEAGGVGKMNHVREPVAIEKQSVVRMNRDTLYSAAVIDLAAGPATITLPDAGKRFMSLMVLNQDHYVAGIHYDHKPHTITQKDVGSRYAFIAVRTLADPKDLEAVHRLQDSIKISQSGAGRIELPAWDEAA